MPRSTTPPTIEIEMKDLDPLLERLKASVPEQDYEKLEALCNAYVTLTDLIEDERMTIRRLREMLYGRSTEKTSQVMAGVGVGEDGASGAGGDSNEQESLHRETSPSERTSKGKAKGHGRNGAAAYKGADTIPVAHDELKHGQRCPGCETGKLYRKKPEVLVRITGEPPLRASLYELERFRCNLCGEVFKASAPQGVGETKYDPTSAAMIALLRYGSGLPFNRLEGLQGAMGIPLPASTQWDVVREAAEGPELAFRELIRQGADGDVLHNDDTSMKILSLAKEHAEIEDGISAERTGMFTSGIVSTRQGRKVALFFTGRKHAGENLADVLSQRTSELASPIQMCDALSRNLPKSFEVILSNCLTHGRRNFVKIVDNFPDECRHVLESLAEVYHNDALARKRNLSPEQRMHFHQENSEPILEELKTWFEAQIADKKVEPNSPLGKAMRYMTKRWDTLTRFLRVPGAPLHNNICERALKKAVLHRKNSLFYKTTDGARVGDVYLSLIYTAELNGIDPFDYLTELIRHSSEIEASPAGWMPWNYQDTFPGVNT